MVSVVRNKEKNQPLRPDFCIAEKTDEVMIISNEKPFIQQHILNVCLCMSVLFQSSH